MAAGIRANELAALGICRPTLLLDERRARRNIERMVRKAASANVRFRPHFKTHQSADVGAWFRSEGVGAITVSSVDMALYFATHGWRDLTVAFPANVLEVEKIETLARENTVHLAVDTPATVAALAQRLRQPVSVWVEIDVGGRRAGVPWEQPEAVLALVRALRDTTTLRFAGLLTHAGHSYAAESAAGVLEVHATSLARMTRLQELVRGAGLGPCALSVGDTPCCSLALSFPGVDEIRPGNFVFYDLTQARLGACTEDDIAVAVACPVVGKSRERRQLVLYGGAVHLSKESLRDAAGRTIYGRLATWQGDSWGPAAAGTALVSLSQEHGLAAVDEALLAAVEPGDLVVVLPVHSCLSTDLYGEYRTLQGECLPRRQSNLVPPQ